MRRRWPARIVIVGSRFRNRSRTPVALCPRPWPTPALRPNGEPPAKASSAYDTDGSGRSERAEVVAIDLVPEGALARLVQARELEVDPAAVGHDQPVERDGEPALVPVLNRLGHADHARSARDQDPLAVGRIERDRDGREHRSGELARELREEHPFEERPRDHPSREPFTCCRLRRRSLQFQLTLGLTLRMPQLQGPPLALSHIGSGTVPGGTSVGQTVNRAGAEVGRARTREMRDERAAALHR